MLPFGAGPSAVLFRPMAAAELVAPGADRWHSTMRARLGNTPELAAVSIYRAHHRTGQRT
jgi:hypothetical protein